MFKSYLPCLDPDPICGPGDLCSVDYDVRNMIFRILLSQAPNADRIITENDNGIMLIRVLIKQLIKSSKFLEPYSMAGSTSYVCGLHIFGSTNNRNAIIAFMTHIPQAKH